MIMAAALLAVRSGISAADRDLLVLAALVHDLDHHGRRAAHYPLYRQERLSARMAARILLRCGTAPQLVRRLERLLFATAPASDAFRNSILSNDPLARLLSDADLFASLCYERRMAVKLTGMLKHEQGFASDTGAMLDAFAARMGATGMASDAGRMLLRELVSSRQPHRNVVGSEG